MGSCYEVAVNLIGPHKRLLSLVKNMFLGIVAITNLAELICVDNGEAKRTFLNKF